MARSFSTARARRAKVAASAFCCRASKVGVCRARSSSLVGARLVSRTDTAATPISASAGAANRTCSRTARSGSGPASRRAPIGLAAEILQRRLAGDAAEARLDPLDRFALQPPGAEVDREIDPARQQFGIDHAPADRPLEHDGLEVPAAAADEQGHLAVVHRHLADAGGLGPEPEDQPPPALPEAAVAEADDVAARLAPKLGDHTDVADRSHDGLLKSRVTCRSGRVRPGGTPYRPRGRPSARSSRGRACGGGRRIC